MIVDRYYYAQLNKQEQAVYKAFYNGLMAHEDVIPIPIKGQLSKEVFNKIFRAMTRDNPLIYYVNQSACNWATDAFGHTAICPQYFYSRETVRKYNRNIENAVNNLAAQLKLTEGTDYEKEIRVHDWFCKNVKYDFKGSDMDEPARVVLSHNIVGVFAKQKAQCEGIAKAVKVLLNAVDIKCIDSRGVDILMKSNDYASLPQHWKNYCRGTENATFPLIIIDDEVAWYGLPTANWKFDVDKTTSLKTVVYIMVRFKGKNTVEMLKALTDIETVAIGVNTKKLLKKDNNMVTHPMASSSGAVVPDDGKSAYGLAGFVEEKEFCPACKSHMVLTKNARGTAYLKCSNKACKETKYLTVDLMNWYISSHNVGCPKHDGGELKGRLGKYGPYVTCTCGHTLKPHDI